MSIPVYTIPNPGAIRSDELGDLAGRALHEFSDVADYIWKSPRLIDHETALERKKLQIYFSERPDMAAWRWRLESQKLESVFPYLIAVGNLFSVLSVLEIYLLLLHQLLKKHVSVSEILISGQGATRSINYIKAAGAAVGSIALYEQVQAATRIRNCFVHAAGLLSSSREERELRRIQAKKIYLDPQLRKRLVDDDDRVAIFNTPLGDKLQITNFYSHLACAYARDFFINLCKAIDDKFPLIP